MFNGKLIDYRILKNLYEKMLEYLKKRYGDTRRGLVREFIILCLENVNEEQILNTTTEQIKYSNTIRKTVVLPERLVKKFENLKSKYGLSWTDIINRAVMICLENLYKEKKEEDKDKKDVKSISINDIIIMLRKINELMNLTTYYRKFIKVLHPSPIIGFDIEIINKDSTMKAVAIYERVLKPISISKDIEIDKLVFQYVNANNTINFIKIDLGKDEYELIMKVLEEVEEEIKKNE